MTKMLKSVKLKTLGLVLISIILVSCFHERNAPEQAEHDPANCLPETVIDIPDKNEFYPRLISYFGKALGDPITCGDMQSLSAFSGMSGGTIDLTGIEYATNLTSLGFANVHVKSLAPLKELKQLKSLVLSVDAIPLPGGFDCDKGFGRSVDALDTLLTLPQLESLTLQDSSIQDLSFLKNLSQLKSLNLRCNMISNLAPLEKLTQLEFLVLGGNGITNLDALAELESLSYLSLERNCPKTLEPLTGLVNLRELSISGDRGSANAPSYCPLSDFLPLSKLEKLESLSIINTNFDDLSLLSSFPNLKGFGLSHNNISNLSPLADVLVNRSMNTESPPLWLNFTGNNIKDIKGFAASVPTFEPGFYELDLWLNCFETDPSAVDLLRSKGIKVTIDEQKPECSMRVYLPRGVAPIFYWP